MKPLRRHAVTPLTTLRRYNATSLQRQRRRSQSICFFISAYHFHYFHFQFRVLPTKIYQRIYSRKSDNNSVTRGKARFIYLQLQLHCNLSRVRRLPQGSLLHEPVTVNTTNKFQNLINMLVKHSNNCRKITYKPVNKRRRFINMLLNHSNGCRKFIYKPEKQRNQDVNFIVSLQTK